MRIRMRKHPLSIIKKAVLSLILCTSFFLSPLATAEVMNIPLQRTVATQPVTTLEVVAIVKSLLNGRVLSITKQSSYSNPDCHQVKLLEDKGEFHIIWLGCHIDALAQTEQK